MRVRSGKALILGLEVEGESVAGLGKVGSWRQAL